uniref:Coiled-coil domain containing 88A n=1 Tax=Callorhinchus milii TaxID=7868 RepID=A0A4W3GPS4_CALMI
MEVELKRLQQENQQLLSDARSARAYRDELDSLREKAIKVDKLESEVIRYKERLHDIDFYKARTEELKEDNKILLETKAMLEDQLEGARARCDKLHELEKESLQLMAKLHDMEMERDTDRKRIEELLEENLTLEMAQKQSMDESLHLGWELEQLSKCTELSEGTHKSLGQEVNELTSSRLLKLEKENQSLIKTVEELRNGRDSTEDSNSKILELEKENQRLRKKMDRLQGEISNEKQSMQDVESLSNDLIKEKSQLEKTIQTIRENSERQIEVLEQENEHLNQTIASLRQRTQISAEARVKDIEKENKILHESIKETSGKLNKLEFEKKQIRKELEHYKEKGERAEELEKVLSRLERENEQLQKKITGLKITCEKVDALEQENSDLEVENRKVKKSLDSLKNLTVQLEALEKENCQLDDENLQLRRTVESLKSTTIKLAQLELENKELESEKDQLKKSLDLLKACNKKTERLEVSYQGLDLENHRLQKALENSSKKINQLENELQDLETENHSLQRNLEELKISSKHLEQLEKENKLLEQETVQLEKDKKQLEKENKRLRQQVEIKDSTLDENNLKIASLEKENKSLAKEISKFKDSLGRLKDLEKENREHVKQATIDKKTLLTLREDLVNEKLQAQQMNNDLEKLTHELEKIGLNKERLLQDEETTDESRYKLLEYKLESTLKQSLEIKEEKIATLEARLEESTNLNQQLRQELKTVKKNYEALKQRHEEEKVVQSSQGRSGEEFQATSKWERESKETTRELLKVKDRLIEVERNVENSTLGSQSASLMTQNSQLQIQQSSVENENESLMKEKEEFKSMYDSLVKDHEKLAKLHERQATEYETLINKHGTLKCAHKYLEVEHKDLEDRYNELLKQKDQLEELESMLKKEQEKMQQDSKKHEAMMDEFQKLSNEKDRLNQIYSQLLKENEGLQLDHKNLKSLLNCAKLEQTRLEADFAKLKEQYQQLDITSTKLNNQCELLSQLKGNLEEENRHLLDQIQTLMLQNRTLLEQSMESKDLFHVEQRQYIDKLNELRRQKEKLEEKIMDQYKFYEPSPPRRRGNWIAIKMKKLIKHKKEGNRERIKSLTNTPTRSESSDGFLHLPHQDSQDSSSVGSNSLDDNQASKKSSTMNDLLQSLVSAGAQWSGSSENLEGHNEVPGGQRRTELRSMAFSTTAINLAAANSSGFRSKQKLNFTSCCFPIFHSASRPTSLDSSRTSSSNNNNNAHDVKAGAINGNRSRSQSHSSEEYGLIHDHQVSSSSSTPTQSAGHHAKCLEKYSPSLQQKESRMDDTKRHSRQRSKTTSPGSEVVTLQQFLEESNINPSSQLDVTDNSATVRGSGGKETAYFSSGKSQKSGHYVKSSLQKPDGCCVTSTPVETTIQTQGKTGSSCELEIMSQQPSQAPDCSASPILPRASHVISTAEGSSRRTSIHEFMSRDSRPPVSVDPSPAKVVNSTRTLPSEYQADHYHHPHFPHHVTYQTPDDKDQTISSPASSFDLNLVSYTMITNTVQMLPNDQRVPFNNLHLSQSNLSTNPVSHNSRVPQRSTAWPTDIAMVSPIKVVQNQDFQNQNNSELNSSLSKSNVPSDECARESTDVSVSPSVMTEDKQTVWYEYGCV